MIGDLADIREHCLRFAHDYPELPVYQRICSAVAADDETASLLLAAQPGQARPVLLLAALHDLVLSDPSVPAARWFRPRRPTPRRAVTPGRTCARRCWITPITCAR